MNSKQFLKSTALARTLHPKHRTHVVLLICILVLTVAITAYSLYSGNSFWLAIQSGLWMAVAAFLTWSVAREIDPDNEWSAFVAIPLTALAMFIFNFTGFSIIAVFLTLLCLRLTNRIIGPPATRNDMFTIISLVVIAAFFDSWIAGLVAALGLVFSGTMNNPERSHLPFAGLAVAIVIICGIVRSFLDLLQMGSLSTTYLISITLIGIFYAVTMIAYRSTRVKTDIRGYTVDIKRIRAGMMLGLMAVVILVIWRGDNGVIAMFPVWSAMLGISIYRIPISFRELMAFNQARQKS